MKTYTIGETISRFQKDSIAFIYKGDAKGVIMFCDAKDNMLTSFVDGEFRQDLYIKLKDIPLEESRSVVFPNEFTNEDMDREDVKNIMDDYNECINSLLGAWVETLSELSREERMELLNYYKSRGV